MTSLLDSIFHQLTRQPNGFFLYLLAGTRFTKTSAVRREDANTFSHLARRAQSVL